MKKNNKSKNWIKKQNKDPYVKASKVQGYRSRSAFKLIEMNKKFNLISQSTDIDWRSISLSPFLENKAKKMHKKKINKNLLYN